MLELIEARKSAETRQERDDLFSNLLEANEDSEDRGAKLTTEELLGNIFIFQLAGHEVR